ncbi:MAG: hypothetical protein HXX08_20680 [Chloroflexi bacterium]|uniref:Uncharacterized protein n=1 Tax=Candidatus Chlorohelix allophototropha TaxID=3003348 RepID=A0A8T7M834_9CHLR|nr:hypothetical protein [Chloroflexota bacterium]WJW68214.1 hypothetical protein OZ401_003819 [Chloroflexota bacterium L227-S17]
MTVFTLALANLERWVRDYCFPASYVQLQLEKAVPFSDLGGRVNQQPFNNSDGNENQLH